MCTHPEITPAPTRFLLQWHITHRCNLCCAHCYQDDYAAEMSDAELTQTLDKYERYLHEIGASGHIYLTGGEPLRHPSFFSISEQIVRRGIPLSVLTNGTLIREKEAKRLARLQPEFVQISLDGTPEIHDGIRGLYSFERAMKGIDALVEMQVPVLVSFTAQKNNVRCFASLARICNAHHVRKLWWDRVVTDTPESTQALALTTKDFARLCKKAARLRERYRRPDGSSLVSCERSLQFLDGTRCYTCHAGKDMVTILADGSVMPCRRLPFVIGNISDAELGQLLRESRLTQELAAAPIPDACAQCRFAEQCRGGAKCVTFGQTGELYRKDVNCFYKV